MINYSLAQNDRLAHTALEEEGCSQKYLVCLQLNSYNLTLQLAISISLMDLLTNVRQTQIL